MNHKQYVLANQEWSTFVHVCVQYSVHVWWLYAPCLQYLESVHPLLNDKDYQEMERLVEDFKVYFHTVIIWSPTFLYMDHMTSDCHHMITYMDHNFILSSHHHLHVHVLWSHDFVLSSCDIHMTSTRRMVLVRRCSVTSTWSPGGLPITSQTGGISMCISTAGPPSWSTVTTMEV